jgi:hypothetical protein
MKNADNTKLTITLHPRQWDVVGAALGNLAYKVAAPIFEEMNRQFAEQDKKPELPEGEKHDA